MVAAPEIAHLYQNASGIWVEHPLDEHCKDVAELASTLLADCTPDIAQLAGLWHDLGKYQPRFQQYIRNASGYERENAHAENTSAPARAPHSTAGAKHATTRFAGQPVGQIIAYLIAGHHAGLPDGKRGDFQPLASFDVRLGNTTGRTAKQTEEPVNHCREKALIDSEP